jgi:CTP-dependent riboflavin kinase
MATAAAIVARARRDVVSHFMERNAVSPDAAVRWVPERHVQRRMLARLVRRGVLVEAGEDTYFVDVPAYDRWRRSLRLRTVVLLAGVAVAGAALAALA